MAPAPAPGRDRQAALQLTQPQMGQASKGPESAWGTAQDAGSPVPFLSALSSAG